MLTSSGAVYQNSHAPHLYGYDGYTIPHAPHLYGYDGYTIPHA